MPHPYRVIGEKLGMEEKEVFNRIARLKASGIIRRLGASINSRRIGFVSTLLAAKVPPEKFDLFVKAVNDCPGVTHNYERNMSIIYGLLSLHLLLTKGTE